MANRRYYYAVVLNNLADCFEKKVKELGDKIRIVSRIPYFSNEGEPRMYYLLNAEDGVIDPKYEFKGV